MKVHGLAPETLLNSDVREGSAARISVGVAGARTTVVVVILAVIL